jgi:divalent metal cation (Fe/Co/Zn/Cd) transporter
MTVSHVREIHDLSLIDLADGGTQAALHLKLPGDVPLERAHAVAEQVEAAVRAAAPQIVDVQTHLEPLAERAAGEPTLNVHDVETIERVVTEVAGRAPRGTRVLTTPDGLVVLLTITLAGDVPLARAHDEAGAVAARVRAAIPGVADVIVHTEP